MQQHTRDPGDGETGGDPLDAQLDGADRLGREEQLAHCLGRRLVPGALLEHHVLGVRAGEERYDRAVHEIARLLV
ncbi:hypothetical protein GCM10009608_16000 [Pseudonocardia alaniniphila]